MKTRMKLMLVLMALLILTNRVLSSSVENFTKSVRYTAPTNFYMFDYSSDNYPTPFTIGGSGIEYDHDPNSSIMFELGFACYSIGDGKAFKFLPATPVNLKEDFEKCYRDKFTNMPPATISKISGLTAVSSTMTSPSPLGTIFFHSCWIQIKTNIVVKISATSCDAKVFNALTNSFQSIKINKAKILELVASQKQIPYPW
jgi:hypothetical protein